MLALAATDPYGVRLPAVFTTPSGASFIRTAAAAALHMPAETGAVSHAPWLQHSGLDFPENLHGNDDFVSIFLRKIVAAPHDYNV